MSGRSLAADVAALAAIAVWVYAGTALGVAAFGDGAGLPFWPVAAAVALPYLVVKLLSLTGRSQRTLRLVGVAASVGLLYLIGRMHIAGDASVWHLGWTLDLVLDPFATLEGHAAQVTAVVFLTAAWLFGVVRASSTSSYDGLLVESSIGLVVVFFTAAFGPATEAPASLRWLPAPYMVFILLALALAHLPTVEDQRRGSFLGTWVVWLGAGLTAIAAIALIPTFVDPPSVAALGHGIAFVIRGVALGIAILVSPFILALGWLAGLLFGLLSSDPFVPEPPVSDGLAEEANEEQGDTTFGRVLGRITRGGVVIVLIVIAIALLWLAFRRVTRKRADDAEVREEIETTGANPLEGLRSLFSNALQRMGRGPRWSDAVGQLYFSVLRRAEEQGLPRPPAATPLEFARILDRHFGSQIPGAISRAYSEARYAARPPPQELLGELRAGWNELGRGKDAG